MDDLISRQAAIELFNDNTLSLEDGAYVQERLKQLPTVQPKTGHWIPVTDNSMDAVARTVQGRN